MLKTSPQISWTFIVLAAKGWASSSERRRGQQQKATSIEEEPVLFDGRRYSETTQVGDDEADMGRERCGSV